MDSPKRDQALTTTVDPFPPPGILFSPIRRLSPATSPQPSLLSRSDLALASESLPPLLPGPSYPTQGYCFAIPISANPEFQLNPVFHLLCFPTDPLSATHPTGWCYDKPRASKLAGHQYHSAVLA